MRYITFVVLGLLLMGCVTKRDQALNNRRYMYEKLCTSQPNAVYVMGYGSKLGTCYEVKGIIPIVLPSDTVPFSKWSAQ